MVTRSQAKLIQKLRRRKRREEADAFLVEGVRMAEELLRARSEVRLVVTAPGLEETDRGRRLLAEIEARGWPRATASEPELRRLADTETPQGVLAVVARPDRHLKDFTPGPSDALLIFDGLGDPGNLGTLLRTAWGLGVVWTVALPGTVDPWNPKAVRASAGAVLHVPISREPWSDVLVWLRAHDVAILCADPSGDPVHRTGESTPAGRFALVLGSEASGAGPEVRRDADRVVALESSAGVDSLNVAVAGALLLDRLMSEPERGRGPSRDADA